MAETTVSTREVQINSNVDRLLQPLKREQIVDDEGTRRDVLTFHTKNGVSVRAIFYSPEELPFSQQAIQGRQAFIYGDKPKWREGGEWDTFVGKVSASSQNRPGASPVSPIPAGLIEAVQSGNSIFFVEATPQHILDFAFTLGVENRNLREARQRVSHRKTNPEAERLLDRVIAGKIIDDNGEVRNELNYEGEALAVLSMLGDSEASKVLDSKAARLSSLDETRDAKALENLKSFKKEGREPLKLEDLVAVQLTRYLPQSGEDGQSELVTTFDATGGKVFRDTIHFTLNHPVEDHMYGSWASAPYAIVAPLDKMIEVNGNPDVLNTIDTFYEVSPGGSVKLPEGTVIVKPGEVATGELFDDKGTEVVYKAKDLAPEDVSALAERLNEWEHTNLNEALGGDMLAHLQYHRDSPVSSADLQELARVMRPDPNAPRSYLDILKLLQEDSIDSVVNSIIAHAEMAADISPAIRRELVQQIEGKLTTEIKEKAIRGKINQMGYVDKPGGMWAWGDSWETTYQTIDLAAQMGIWKSI